MYPAGELIRLAERKSALRRSIARRRIECVALATEAARPLAWIDRVYRLWQKFAPLVGGIASAASGAGGLKSFSRLRILLTAARLAPALFRVFSAFRATRTKTRAAADES